MLCLLALGIVKWLPWCTMVAVLVPIGCSAYTEAWSIFYNASICSLLKGLGLGVTWASAATTLLMLSCGGRAVGFQSVGFPCSFQQVSFVCPVLLQCSHQGWLFFHWEFPLDWGPGLQQGRNSLSWDWVSYPKVPTSLFFCFLLSVPLRTLHECWVMAWCWGSYHKLHQDLGLKHKETCRSFPSPGFSCIVSHYSNNATSRPPTNLVVANSVKACWSIQLW